MVHTQFLYCSIPKTSAKDVDVIILIVVENAKKSISGPAVPATRHDKRGVIRTGYHRGLGSDK